MRETLIAAIVAAITNLASAGGFDIDVAVTRSPFAAALEQACGRFPACTHFVAPMLTANCVNAGQQWRIDASARVTALTYLIDISLIAHERLHLMDIRRGVSALLERVEASRFDSESACRAEAESLTGGFRREVGRIAAKSLAERQ